MFEATRWTLVTVLTVLIGTAAGNPSAAQEAQPQPAAAMPDPAQLADQKLYQEYMDFFTEVYKTVQENYFFDVDQVNFRKFIHVFNTKIYPQLLGEKKSRDYIRWRSSAYLIDFLKSPDDIFSAFMPPQAAKDYEEEVLGKRIDLGIEGDLTPLGFEVSRVEPRSDAYEKGLRGGDRILKIDSVDVLSLTKDKVLELLTPLEGATVQLRTFNVAKNSEEDLAVFCKEYFKQTVFMVPVDVPDVFCLQIQRFNRMTSDDLTRFMTVVLQQGGKGLILDLRGNPGGPPLAAREISAFFLTPNEMFAYFQKRNMPRAELFVPEIPPQYRFQGDIVILVDKGSGSASELFSGILQSQKRAVIMGTNTAGQVFLKSMFYFSDQSMVLLVTARGFHPDGTVFSFGGVVPDERVEDPGSPDLVKTAAQYLAQKIQQNNKTVR